MRIYNVKGNEAGISLFLLLAIMLGGCSEEQKNRQPTQLREVANVTPVAKFKVYGPDKYSQFTFDANSSHDPDGTIVTYSWYLSSDGEPGHPWTSYLQGAKPNWTRSSRSPTKWTVKLTVTDNDGASSEISHTRDFVR